MVVVVVVVGMAELVNLWYITKWFITFSLNSFILSSVYFQWTSLVRQTMSFTIVLYRNVVKKQLSASVVVTGLVIKIFNNLAVFWECWLDNWCSSSATNVWDDDLHTNLLLCKVQEVQFSVCLFQTRIGYNCLCMFITWGNFWHTVENVSLKSR